MTQRPASGRSKRIRKAPRKDPQRDSNRPRQTGTSRSRKRDRPSQSSAQASPKKATKTQEAETALTSKLSTAELIEEAIQTEQRAKLACHILAARGRITAEIIPGLCSVLPRKPEPREKKDSAQRLKRRTEVHFTGQSRSTTMRQLHAMLRCLQSGEDLLSAPDPAVALHDAMEESKIEANLDTGPTTRPFPEGFCKGFLESESVGVLRELLKETAETLDPAKAAVQIPHLLAPWADPGRNLLASQMVILAATKKRNPHPEWLPHYSELADHECCAILACDPDREDEEIGLMRKLIERGIRQARQDRQSASQVPQGQPSHPGKTDKPDEDPKVYLAVCGQTASRTDLIKAMPHVQDVQEDQNES